MLFRMDAYRLYVLMVAIRNFSSGIAFTLFALYLLRDVGTNPLELVLPGTAYEATIFLFEIPTGVVADVYSRRLSVIIGHILLGIGFIVSVTVPLLAVVVVGLMIAGLGSTFISGALSAWLVDEIGQENAAKAFVRSTQVRLIFELLGVILSVVLGSISLQLAIGSSGAIMVVLAIVLIATMPETGFQGVPASERETWQDLFKTFREGAKVIRLNHIFLWIFVVTFIFSGFGEGFGRLWPALVLDNFSLSAIGTFGEELWFGIIRAGVIPLTLVVTEIVRRRVDLADSDKVVRTLMFVFYGMIISVLMVALSTQSLLVVIGLWITRMLQTVAGPLLEAWINQHITSHLRATILSVKGQVNSLGEIIGGPALGIIGTLATVRVAIAFSVMLIGVLLGVIHRVPNTAESPSPV